MLEDLQMHNVPLDRSMSVTVSVILPVHNRLSSIETACRSVLDQSYRDLELIVVDDASTEEIEPVVRAIDDPRLVYLQHERNLGAGAARNTGLAAAKGRLIAFQDSDDIWLPQKLASQVALLDSLPENVGAVMGSRILYGADVSRLSGPGRVVVEPSSGAALALADDQLLRILHLNRLSVQNTLFRRDCLPDGPWFDALALASEDWDLAIRLLQHTKILEDPDPVVLSYVSPDSISRDNRKKITGLVRILKNNRSIYQKHPEAHGCVRYALGRRLTKTGKPKLGRPFVWQGLKMAPRRLTRDIAGLMVARIRRKLQKV